MRTIDKANEKLNNRLRAMKPDPDAQGVMSTGDGVRVFFVGLPITSQEGLEYAEAAIANLIVTLERDEATDTQAIIGLLLNALVLGILIGMDQ
jgi:hypothetical protein